MQLEKKIKSVTIMIKMVGTACNMNCDYCYEHITEDSHKNIYGGTGEDVIDYLRQFVEYKHVFILFHGGEPFLAKYNEVRKCLEYIKQNFKYDYKIQFQTNGTLLNDEWIYLLRQYEPNISLSISLDPRGNKDLRKSQGFEYRKIVKENLEKYSNSINNIGIVAVAHKYNPAVILKLRDLRCLQYMMSCCFAQPVHDRSSDTCLRKCFTVNVINFLFIKFT